MDNKEITPINVKNDETVKDIVKHKRPNSSLNHQVQLNDGDMSKYLNHTMTVSSWGKLDMHNPQLVGERVDLYFKTCMLDDMKPSVAELALAFGLHRTTFHDYVCGNIKVPQACLDHLKRAYTILNALMENYMQNGKINPVSGIFLMKNNMGYHDQQEYVLTPNTRGEEDPKDLINEANQLPGSDD